MNKETFTENDPEFDMFSNLATTTPHQSTTKIVDARTAFIEKCLHPPSAIPNYHGLPTNDARSQVALEWRNIYLHRPAYSTKIVATLPTVTAMTNLPTEIAILTTNSPRINAFTFIKVQETGMQLDGFWAQDLNNTMINDNYQFNPSWSRDANVYRPAYRSHTSYLNATMFNNVGIVVATQFNPNLLFAGTLTQFAIEQPNVFVDFVVGEVNSSRALIVKNVKDVEHAYRKFPLYLRREVAERLEIDENFMLTLDPGTNIQVLDFGNMGQNTFNSTPYGSVPVPTASNVLQSSVRSYGGKARDGNFSVQRLNTIAPSWLAANTIKTSGSSTNPLYQCYFHFVAITGVNVFNPLYDNVPLGSVMNITNLPNQVATDALWSKDMTFTWTLYSGLSYSFSNTNPDGSNLSSQILIHKFYSGFEIQAALASAWGAVLTLGPKPDLEAMQALMDAFYELKDGMPAKYNFLGTLASLAIEGIKTFGASLLSKLLIPTPKQPVPVKSNRSNTKKVGKAKNLAIMADKKKIVKLENQISQLQLQRSSNRAPTPKPRATRNQPAAKRAYNDLPPKPQRGKRF